MNDWERYCFLGAEFYISVQLPEMKSIFSCAITVLMWIALFLKLIEVNTIVDKHNWRRRTHRKIHASTQKRFRLSVSKQNEKLNKKQNFSNAKNNSHIWVSAQNVIRKYVKPRSKYFAMRIYCIDQCIVNDLAHEAKNNVPVMDGTISHNKLNFCMSTRFYRYWFILV